MIAKAARQPNQKKIDLVVAKGFTEDQAYRALAATSDDVDLAIERLMAYPPQQGGMPLQVHSPQQQGMPPQQGYPPQLSQAQAELRTAEDAAPAKTMKPKSARLAAAEKERQAAVSQDQAERQEAKEAAQAKTKKLKSARQALIKKADEERKLLSQAVPTVPSEALNPEEAKVGKPSVKEIEKMKAEKDVQRIAALDQPQAATPNSWVIDLLPRAKAGAPPNAGEALNPEEAKVGKPSVKEIEKMKAEKNVQPSPARPKTQQAEAFGSELPLPVIAGVRAEEEEEWGLLQKYGLDPAKPPPNSDDDVNKALDATACPSGEDMAHGLNSASKPKPTPRPSQCEGKEIDSRAMRMSQTRLERSQIRKPSPKQSDGIHCTGSKGTATRNKSK